MLDFLNQTLPWNEPISTLDVTENVGAIKAMCLTEPEKYLWTNEHTKNLELRNIFESIKGLAYTDRPNYEYIRLQLLDLLKKERQHETEKGNPVLDLTLSLLPKQNVG
jgi:hypothetical protein